MINMMTETLANIHINKHSHRKEKPNNNNNNNIPKMTSTVSVFNNIKLENNVKRTGSFVFGQKLRESKWFNQSELRIFCAVVETGFIIEHKQNDSNETTRNGVAIWKPTFEKSKDPNYLTIYTTIDCKGKLKVVPMKLEEFWPDGTLIRINNSSDKSQTPLAEEDIRNQVEVAEGFRKKWHNNEHFVYFCRYGPVESANLRMRKITDQLRLNAGTLFLRIRNMKSK